jgi:Putative Flp pilus-assembly TadE/G-like
VTTQRDQRESAAGQALVIMVGGMLAVLVMVGLIVDGGNAWAQQRIVQNGSDAAAEAGAVILGQRLAGATAPLGGWDVAVASAVSASAAANGITETAYYTDICGIPLKADGNAALTAGAYDLAHAQPVGSGLPAVISSAPDCPSHTVGPAAGVIVLGHKAVQTYVVNVVGISTWSVNTQATAAAGYLQESCDASQGDVCALLPVAIPVDIVTCDGSNRPVNTGFPWVADATTVYKVPLCSNGPGNVGWLDWNPPGGVPDTIQSIITPDNPAIPLPSWQYVASTGGPNSPGIETAIRHYDGQIVLLPQFDLTCNPGPHGTPDNSVPAINTSPNYGCPAGDLGGNGTNQWYRMPSFAHFQLCISTDTQCAAVGASYGAYTNGNNKAVCDTGNGATQCLVGKFVSYETSGTIGAGFGGGTGSSKAIGIQLIK